MDRNWRSQKQPLKQISGNAHADPEYAKPGKELPEQFDQRLSIRDADAEMEHEAHSNKAKARKSKLREVKGETQTGECHFPC